MYCLANAWCLHFFIFRWGRNSLLLWRIEIHLLGLDYPYQRILQFLSNQLWPKIWTKRKFCRLCIWQSALYHRGKQTFHCSLWLRSSSICCQRRDQWWGTMLLQSCCLLLNLRTYNYLQIQRRARASQWRCNQEATIAHGNKRFTIGNIFYRFSTKFFVWYICHWHTELQNLIIDLNEFMSRYVNLLLSSSPIVSNIQIHCNSESLVRLR